MHEVHLVIHHLRCGDENLSAEFEMTDFQKDEVPNRGSRDGAWCCEGG